MKNVKVCNILFNTIFIFYLFILIKILFLDQVSLTPIFSQSRVFPRYVNVMPFHTIAEYLCNTSMVPATAAIQNLLGNIILFIPMGIFLPIYRPDKSFCSNKLIFIGISLSAELIQYILSLGAADVDDLILNTLGGLIGILSYKLLLEFSKDTDKIKTIVTCMALTAGVVTFSLAMLLMPAN